MKTVSLATAAAAALCFISIGSAIGQTITIPVSTDTPAHTIVNAAGEQPTMDDELIYRNGPNNPITDRFDNHLTWGDFNKVGGSMTITAIPGGGTQVDVNVTGLLEGEVYSVWAGYWGDEGFPTGPRYAFGYVSDGTAADTVDNFATADANGEISLSLVQPEGPMSIEGSAPAFAPQVPVLDAVGNPQSHTGYSAGLAYHWDADPPYFPGPGSPDTWAIAAIAVFPPVPEPSSAVLVALGVAFTAATRQRL